MKDSRARIEWRYAKLAVARHEFLYEEIEANKFDQAVGQIAVSVDPIVIVGRETKSTIRAKVTSKVLFVGNAEAAKERKFDLNLEALLYWDAREKKMRRMVRRELEVAL